MTATYNDYQVHIPINDQNMRIFNQEAAKVKNFTCAQKTTVVFGAAFIVCSLWLIVCAAENCFSDSCSQGCSDTGRTGAIIGTILSGLGTTAACFAICKNN